MRSLKILCMTVLAILAAMPAASAEPACGFEAVLSQHLENAARLLGTRGLPPPPRPDDVAAFGQALKTYLEPGTALLIFGSSGADHCVLLLRRDANARSALLNGSLAEAGQALAQFAEARGIARAAHQRAPRRRGAMAVEEPAAQPGAGAAGALRQLSAIILPEAIREGLADIRHLLIVPSGNIGAVPFSALPLDRAGTVLAERMSFAILPNLLEAAPGYLRITPDYDIEEPETSQAAVLGPALVVGDPDGSGDPDWDFPPLPGARAESQDIAVLYSVKPLTGREATLPAVVDGLALRPRLIYFAAHGIADPGDPLTGSFIKLSGGRLDALTIQRMTLPAVPVFLSACQTGLGLAHDGGIIGLARAFDIAGAGPVLMSLWNIDDAATRSIMTATVRNLEGHPLPEALRLAVVAFRRAHPAQPELWAAFSVFGR